MEVEIGKTYYNMSNTTGSVYVHRFCHWLGDAPYVVYQRITVNNIGFDGYCTGKLKGVEVYSRLDEFKNKYTDYSVLFDSNS